MKQILRTLSLSALTASIALALSGCSSSNSNSPTVTATPTPQTWALKKTISRHKEQIYNLSFSPDSRQLASSSKDNAVGLWDVEGNNIAYLVDDTTQQGIIGLAVSPDGQSVAFGSVYVHSVALVPRSNMTGDDVKIKEYSFGKVDSATTIAFSPDGKTLTCGTLDGDVFFWDVDTAQKKQVLKDKDQGQFVGYSPDGKLIAITGGDEKATTALQTVRLWDLQTGELKVTLTGHSGGIWGVAFSPDSKTVATGSVDKTIRIWDVQTGALKQTLTGHGDTVHSVAFSPDGKLLASGSGDKTVKIWDPQKGVLIQTLSDHGAGVWSVIFSPDGKWLASGGEDKTIKLWSTS